MMKRAYILYTVPYNVVQYKSRKDNVALYIECGASKQSNCSSAHNTLWLSEMYDT